MDWLQRAVEWWSDWFARLFKGLAPYSTRWYWQW